MSTCNVGGVDIYYSIKGAGAPILLIHGTGMSADLWGEAINGLAIHNKVISYDRRGHSRSVAPPARDYHMHGEDAAALLRGLNISHATVVGWSAGGIAALDLTINHPDLVSSLVLYEPPLHAKKHPDLGLIVTLIKVMFQRRVQGGQRAAETFLRYALSAGDTGSAWDRWPASWRQIMTANTAATLAELDSGTGEQLTEAQISAITCPVTCIRGELSRPFLRNATDRLLKLLPQATLVDVPGAAHGLHVDHCAQFLAVVRQAADSVKAELTSQVNLA